MDEQPYAHSSRKPGITVGPVHRNLPAPELIARSLARGEGIFAANGALVVTTGERTGRSPADRYIVDEPEAAERGLGRAQPALHTGVLRPPAPARERVPEPAPGLRLRRLHRRRAHLPHCRSASSPGPTWHALFAHTLFVRPSPSTSRTSARLHGHRCRGVAGGAGRRSRAVRRRPRPGDRPSPVFVGVCLSRRLVIILGTMYGGEMKKALFTVMNFLLPIAACCRCTARPRPAARGTSPSTSASRAPARRRCPPIPLAA